MLVGIFTAIQNRVFFFPCGGDGYVTRSDVAAVAAMEVDLSATSSQFSLSIALFIVVQGLIPLVWSAISEIKGRKVYSIRLV
jgi:hypothetical protein